MGDEARLDMGSMVKRAADEWLLGISFLGLITSSLALHRIPGIRPTIFT